MSTQAKCHGDPFERGMNMANLLCNKSPIWPISMQALHVTAVGTEGGGVITHS